MSDCLQRVVSPLLRRHRAIAALFAGALAVAGCAQATGLGVDLVPQEQVTRMGLETWQAIRAETPVSDNAAHQRTAERIAGRILEAAGKSPQEWEVVVFEEDQANAFALPAHKIGIFEGMFRIADTPAQLAAVIAHEIAHIDEAHASERLNTQLGTEMGVQLISTALGAANVAPPEQVARVLGVGAQYGIALPYSRNQEVEADRQGVRYMARAGYDPSAAVELWQEMSAGTARQPAFLSTHPAPEQRIAALREILPEVSETYRANQ